MDQPEITTTPPVHHAGPDTREREIVGGEAARVGLHSLLRDAFEDVVNDVAAKHTTMPIIAPVRQLVEATVRVVGNLPRIPDYDDVSARKQEWSETQSYSPVELPEGEPKTLGVHAEGAVVIVRADLGAANFASAAGELRLDPDHAEGFFLAGLAAARQAKADKVESERLREQLRGGLIVPEGFSRR